jgi:hypothetical protein
VTTNSEAYFEAVRRHYEGFWRKVSRPRRWTSGPIAQLPAEFAVLEFGPGQGRELWTYATCGMSIVTGNIELHLLSAVQAEELVELLTVVAHYHHTGNRLNVGHTVNFGRPWLPGSRCSFGLVSLPYLDGPGVENLVRPDLGLQVRCLWLLPVTPREVQFKKQKGAEALEQLFESAEIDYADPLRKDLAPH